MCMTIGYSAFSSKLDIKGSSLVTSKWDIEITDLQLKQESGDAEDVSHSFDALTANMEANFYMPGDEITYEVTVSNLGTLDAVLDSIKINMDSQDIIEFKVDGITSGEELKQGTSTKFDVIMKYNENITSQPGETSINFSMDLNYLQSGNSSNFADADVPVMDTLAINGIDLTPTETSVKADISATNAVKYYYSLDNDKWYQTSDKTYTIYHLTLYTNYTMYIKAEDALGEVVFSSKTFTTLDDTNPELKLTIGDNVKGENGWYKGLNINIEASDAGGIDESKYCVTSSDTCTPNTTLALTEGKGTYQFASSANSQKLCVLVSDRKGNETSKCTELYKVDGENPTINDMTIEPNENTMTITLSTSDEDRELFEILKNIISSTDDEQINKTIDNIIKKEVCKLEAKNISDIEKKKVELSRLPRYKKGVGLPIGNETSQILAIYYLNGLDHFIKENLHIKGYVRYMDDFILFHHDKDYLKFCLKEIEKYLEGVKLKLNRKTQIYDMKRGFNFLGYKFFLKGKKLIVIINNQTKKE